MALHEHALRTLRSLFVLPRETLSMSSISQILVNTTPQMGTRVTKAHIQMQIGWKSQMQSTRLLYNEYSEIIAFFSRPIIITSTSKDAELAKTLRTERTSLWASLCTPSVDWLGPAPEKSTFQKHRLQLHPSLNTVYSLRVTMTRCNSGRQFSGVLIVNNYCKIQHHCTFI